MADAQQLDPWTQAADPDVMQRKVLLLSTHAILEASCYSGPQPALRVASSTPRSASTAAPSKITR